jgi:hypothetical protein
MLRRIYGAVQTEEGWRVGSKDELEKLMRDEQVIRYVRIQRIKWWKRLKEDGKNKYSDKYYGMESHRNEIQRMSKK